jgi:aerobic carbon-monoxide dehydrogenase medium subunit
MGERIFRMPAIEARIEGQPPSAALFATAAAAAMKAVDPPSDLHADEAYRRDLVKVLAERVLATAAARARH